MSMVPQAPETQGWPLPSGGLDAPVTPRPTELARLVESHTGRDGTHPTALPALWFHRASTPTEPIHTVYQPALCLVASGSKQVLLADDIYHYDPEHFLLVSVDLPVAGQVVRATRSVPYLGVRLDLNVPLLGELLAEVSAPDRRAYGRGLAVSRVEPPLLDAVTRLVQLLETPRDLPILAPLVQREIHYRLLCGDQGERLRQMVAANGQARRIAEAIDWLKRHYDQPLSIEALARAVHMSPSGLHHHFKLVTAMSPLQYQKQLRLQEARRLMLGEAVDAATAGFRVGYESPSQFSHEYRRLFGAPPKRDAERLRGVEPIF